MLFAVVASEGHMASSSSSLQGCKYQQQRVGVKPKICAARTVLSRLLTMPMPSLFQVRYAGNSSFSPQHGGNTGVVDTLVLGDREIVKISGRRGDYIDQVC